MAALDDKSASEPVGFGQPSHIEFKRDFTVVSAEILNFERGRRFDLGALVRIDIQIHVPAAKFKELASDTPAESVQNIGSPPRATERSPASEYSATLR